MPAPARLSSDIILEEAVRMLQEQGLDALTVRGLAARLGVEGPSLYKHFGSKQRLLGQVTMHLLAAQVAQVGEHATWQGWLLGLGRVFWATQTRIRDSARLVVETEFDADQVAAMTSLLGDRLARFGVPASTAANMHFSVQSLVLGVSVLAEGRSAALMRASVPFDTVVDESLRALIAGWEVRVASHPTVASPRR